ncbi:hypothetical protein KEJ51_06330 [Candidatus Bathyarchaeota archaeon]|nr:hypothetical protein [Candidatus Bathyarchaeota archaeon]MBS7628580.1 hypothetical protein [Candidatus Bathyarchaeota archaeon]
MLRMIFMVELLYSLSATLLVSLTSFIGVLAIPLREYSLDKILLLASWTHAWL